MARNVGTVLANNFSRGLITEATGLNFPDNAVTEAVNVVFNKIGSVSRRKGIDIESQAETKTYAESDGIIREFIWQSVALTGGFTFLVLQVGASVVFYELTVNASLSEGIVPVGLDLNDFKAPGAGDINFTPCNFAAGAGYLFITHPSCDPIVLRYNATDKEFESAKITVYIRDFEGVQDGLALSQEPDTLSAEHQYNLKNQGWFQNVRVGAKSTSGGPSTVEPIQDPSLIFTSN